MMEKHSKIYVAGHKGMVGSALVRLLSKGGFQNIVFASSKELDLRDQLQVKRFFEAEQIEYVFDAAAKVGGIHANSAYPASFLYDNLLIQSNLIHQAYLSNVKKLLILGSSCIYPKFAEQPIAESSLLAGYLEPTLEAYAVAKIAGVKMCEYYNKQYGCNFIATIPTNLYGYGDNYHPENAHVLPSLLRRFHEAKVMGAPNVTIWGTGTPLREFMFADDLAGACIFLMQSYDDPQFINIGTGEEVSILHLAQLIAKTVGYTGDILLDPTKPDGTPRKRLDCSKLQRLGYRHQTTLENGLRLTYEEFLKNLHLYSK